MMKPTDGQAELSRNEEKKWNPFEKLCGLRRETPEFRRCCFCVPLRRGLVGWGYLKVAINMWAMFWLVYFTLYYLEVEATEMTLIILLLVDAAFNVLFIVGGHQKKLTCLKIAYFYSIVWLSLVMLVLSCLVVRDICQLVVPYVREREHYSRVVAVILPDFCVIFSVFVVQIYWILLIRSLLAKLQDHTVEFQFSNRPVADAQCTLHEHNPSATDISETDALPAADAQWTLHKNNSSATDISDTDGPDETPAAQCWAKSN